MFRRTKEKAPSSTAPPARPATAPAASTVDDVAPDDSEGRVKVTVRVRPPNDREQGAKIAVSAYPEDKKLTVGSGKPGSADLKKFQFDNIMPETATQKMVYMTVARNIVQDVMKGYNGTILAYGQSGSGKTHTIVGNHGLDPSGVDDLYEFDGIIPTAVKDIFASAEQDPDHTYEVQMAYVQIYMEMVQDLLRPESKDIRIREDPEHGVFMTGVMYVPIYSWDDCHRYMNIGNRNRNFAFTRLNAHSSRSHAVLLIMIERRTKMSKQSIESGTVGKVQKGKLFLIDLAGSERLKKSGSEGLRAEEAKAINLSLSVLGNCIHALADERVSHVPYRDSKLTRLLEDSLGGNAKTSLVIAAGPSDLDVSETLSSLMFGKRAMKVKVRAKVNEEIDFKQRVGDLQADLDSKDEAIMELQIALQNALRENESLKHNRNSSMGEDSVKDLLASGPDDNNPTVKKLKAYIQESSSNYKEVVEGLVNENKALKDQLNVERMNHQETQKALEMQFKKLDGIQRSRNTDVMEISKSRDAAVYQLEKVSSELKAHIQRVQREKLELEDANNKLLSQVEGAQKQASAVSEGELKSTQQRLQAAHHGVQKFRAVYFVHLLSGAVEKSQLRNLVSAVGYWRLLTRTHKIKQKAKASTKAVQKVSKAQDDAAIAQNEVARLKSELRMRAHQWEMAEQEYISGVDTLSKQLEDAKNNPAGGGGETLAYAVWGRRAVAVSFAFWKGEASSGRKRRGVVDLMLRKRKAIYLLAWRTNVHVYSGARRRAAKAIVMGLAHRLSRGWRTWASTHRSAMRARRIVSFMEKRRMRGALFYWASRSRKTSSTGGGAGGSMWKKRAESLRKELMTKMQSWEEMEHNLKDALRRAQGQRSK